MAYNVETKKWVHTVRNIIKSKGNTLDNWTNMLSYRLIIWSKIWWVSSWLPLTTWKPQLNPHFEYRILFKFPQASETTNARLIPNVTNPRVILKGLKNAKIIDKILEQISLCSDFCSWYSIWVDSSLNFLSSVLSCFIKRMSLRVFLFFFPEEYFSCNFLYCSLTWAIDLLISFFSWEGVFFPLIKKKVKAESP